MNRGLDGPKESRKKMIQKMENYKKQSPIEKFSRRFSRLIFWEATTESENAAKETEKLLVLESSRYIQKHYSVNGQVPESIIDEIERMVRHFIRDINEDPDLTERMVKMVTRKKIEGYFSKIQ